MAKSKITLGFCTPDRISALTKKLALSLNIVFLVYLSIFAFIAPRPDLVAAVAFEIGLFLLLVTYRLWRERSPAQQKTNQLVSKIETRFEFLAWTRGSLSLAGAVVIWAALAFLSTDLLAVYCVETGRFEVADCIYEHCAPPTWLPVHPAFSMELLSGAHKQAGDVAAAEAMQLHVLQVRKAIFGSQHELVAAAYADLGEFYRRAGKNTESESCLVNAVSLAKQLRIPQGYGYPLTKLACLLRDEGRYAESAIAFEQALAVRERIFGSNSSKVADTLGQYVSLLTITGETEKADLLQKRATMISASQPATNNCSDLISYMVLGTTFVLLTQKRRFLELAAARVKTS